MNPITYFSSVLLLLALLAIGVFLFRRLPILRVGRERLMRVFRPIRHSSFVIACFLLLLGALAVLFVMVPTKVSAQPYYTNSNKQAGPYQYNDSLVPPNRPATTLKNQYALGIGTGTSITVTDGTVTNTFATNYVYSSPPVVIVTQRGTASSGTNRVESVTTSNFVYRAGAPSITNNWTAIGQ